MQTQTERQRLGPCSSLPGAGMRCCREHRETQRLAARQQPHQDLQAGWCPCWKTPIPLNRCKHTAEAHLLAAHWLPSPPWLGTCLLPAKPAGPLRSDGSSGRHGCLGPSPQSLELYEYVLFVPWTYSISHVKVWQNASQRLSENRRGKGKIKTKPTLLLLLSRMLVFWHSSVRGNVNNAWRWYPNV